ncbi:hypothetical protein [Burkholderia sp. Nafp2/4-1b]|uniref:hypothetical protein n=1 Tax=Burkholderia sp. Nafp2/4-1b TaxID=2116686 RepID=UPI0013CEECD3|nr:hypothetical protein [Burkholderia sp. Nafp2/4-1b]
MKIYALVATVLMQSACYAEPTFKIKPNESIPLDSSITGMAAEICTATPNQGPLAIEVTRNPNTKSNTATIDGQKKYLSLLAPFEFQPKRYFDFCAGAGSKMTITNKGNATVTISCQEGGLVDWCN